jgi:hypothetical protein
MSARISIAQCLIAGGGNQRASADDGRTNWNFSSHPSLSRSSKGGGKRIYRCHNHGLLSFLLQSTPRACYQNLWLTKNKIEAMPP